MTEKKPIGSSDWVDEDDAPLLTREFFEQGTWRDGDTIIRRGRPPTGSAKQLVSLRLDQAVIDGLRAMGPGWQARAHEALRRLVAESAAPTKNDAPC